MKLLNQSNTVSFMLPRALINGIQEIGEQVPRLMNATKGIGKGAVQATQTATPTLAEAMTEAQKLHNTSKWGNRINAAMIATTPIGIAPLFLKDADTKALEQMRKEDARRQALGLPPLAINKQLREKEQEPVPTGFSRSNGDTRIIDLTPEHILKI